MWARVLKLSANPRRILRNILSLDDSPHAIALGVAIGMFFGLTPTVGVQTLFILATVALTRRLFYFNAAAAMAATYVSNPITMLPLYYFWYRLGAIFTGGKATSEQLEAIFKFDGFAGWWEAMCTIGAEVGVPMFVGALITAPIGAAIAYPVCYAALLWVRQGPGEDPPNDSADGSEDESPLTESAPVEEPSEDAEQTVESRCLAV